MWSLSVVTRREGVVRFTLSLSQDGPMYSGDNDLAMDLQDSMEREKRLGKRYSDLFMFMLSHVQVSHVRVWSVCGVCGVRVELGVWVQCVERVMGVWCEVICVGVLCFVWCGVCGVMYATR